MKKKRIIIILVIVLLAGVGFFALSAANAGLSAVNPVMVEKIERDTIVNTVTARGYVAMLNTEMVFSVAMAEVESLYIERNDTVREGDILVRFSERSRERLETRVQEAELSLRSAEIALAESRMPAGDTAIENSRLGVTQTRQEITNIEMTIDNLRRDMERLDIRIADQQRTYDQNRALYELGAVSRDTLDNLSRAVRDLNDERANLESAISRNELSLEGLQATLSHRENVYQETRTRTDTREAQNMIAQRQISVEQARLRLNDARRELDDFVMYLTAPMSGTVTMLSLTRGETVMADRPIIEISDVENFVVRLDVNERNAARLALGQDVEITGSVLERNSVYGTITRIGTIAEQRQTANGLERVMPVEVTIIPCEHSEVLRPGFSLDGRITLETREDIVVVPILATLRDRDGDTFVFVVHEGEYGHTLERRVIELGLYADMFVEGFYINEGELIVTQPTLAMYDGMIVTPMNLEDETNEGGH